VPEAEEGGADAELQYVEVSEDTETLRLTVLTKASPGALSYLFLKSYITIYGCLCIYVQQLNGTLDARSLGTYVFISM
jgi:hypothetical protein